MSYEELGNLINENKADEVREALNGMSEQELGLFMDLLDDDQADYLAAMLAEDAPVPSLNTTVQELIKELNDDNIGHVGFLWQNLSPDAQTQFTKSLTDEQGNKLAHFLNMYKDMYLKDYDTQVDEMLAEYDNPHDTVKQLYDKYMSGADYSDGTYKPTVEEVAEYLDLDNIDTITDYDSVDMAINAIDMPLAETYAAYKKWKASMPKNVTTEDVNGDGDTDVVTADTNGNGKKDTAVVTADSEPEKKEAVKAAKEDLGLDKKDKTSTGKTKGELEDKPKMGPAPWTDDYKKTKNVVSDEKKKDMTCSDATQKNIMAALLDHRF